MEPAAPWESSGVAEAPALVEEPVLELEPEPEPEPVLLLPLPPVVVGSALELELEPELVPDGVGVALVEVARVEVEGVLLEVELAELAVLVVEEVTEELEEISTEPSNLMLCQEPELSE